MIARLILLIGCLLAAPAAAAGESPDRPNVVVILADDLGRELLSTYGGTSYTTPHLDRLAREGLTFETCYATPLCSPSRVELLTTQYSFRSYTAWGEIDRDAETFVRRLRDGGYRTIAGGKWHMGGWGGRPRGIVAAGFERYCSYDYAGVLAASFAGGGNQYWGGTIVRDGEPDRLTRYGPDQFTAYVLNEIRAHVADRPAGARRPFFAYLPLDLMHRPFMPTPAHPDAPAPGEPPPADWLGAQGDAAHFPAMLAHADVLVGRTLDLLDELAIAGETLVVFTADNGTDNVHEAKTVRSRYHGRAVAGGKYFPTELGLNVPLIVRRPGRVRVGRTEALADFTDLGATFCDLAGVDPPERTDGRSLAPLFRGEPVAEKPAVYSWGDFARSSRRYKDPKKYAAGLSDVVRSSRWKLYSDGRLFDLSADRFEERPVPAGSDDEADAARRSLAAFRDRLRGSEPRRW